MRYDHRDWISLAGVGLLAAVLLLAQLDEPYLWQDEAQTALIAGTVLADGIPRGTDGKNFFSQELGAEYAEDHVWRWHTWLSFYAVAGSFAVLGPTTFAARLPFALLGLATVLLAYAAGRSLWRSRDAALASASLLALSVPYLILSRQCRWYAMAAFFALLGLHAYGRIGSHERRHSVCLFVAATLLFHTHYFYVATLLATLLVHSLWLERDRFRRVFIVSGAVTLVNAPWILWFSDIRYAASHTYQPAGLQFLTFGTSLAGDLFRYFLSPLFFVVPLGLVVWRWIRGEPVGEISRATVSGVALLSLFCAIGVLALALLSSGAYFRYLTPMAPAALLLAGLMVGSLASLSRVAALALFALWLALSPIRDFVHEITHEFEGPIGGIVGFLEKNAQPEHTVAISYGDLPLKFYTGLRVVGGLTGEDFSEASAAQWVILRRHEFTGVDRRLNAVLRGHLAAGNYLRYRLGVPDTTFENREDPRLHRFRTAPAEIARVVIYGRKDALPDTVPDALPETEKDTQDARSSSSG